MSYEFDFGHRKFFFKEEWLSYYPWLKSLFGLHGGYKHTMKLETNLVEYLPYTKPSTIRKLIYYLIVIVKHNLREDGEMTPVLLSDCGNKYVDLVESFLANGPGCTEDLDVLFTCENCEITTYDRTIYNYSKKYYSHEFHKLTSDSCICKYCGLKWTYYNMDITAPIICTRNGKKECIHKWKL